MKIKKLTKSLLAVLTICLMLCSVLVFSACEKKDKTADVFEAKELTTEQIQTIYNQAISNAKQSINICIDESDFGGGCFYVYADADGYYNFEFSDYDELEWIEFNGSKWTQYSCIYDNTLKEYKYPSKSSYETNANSYVEVLINEVIDYAKVSELVGGTQTAKNVYKLSYIRDNGEMLIEFEIVEGFIKNIILSSGEGSVSLEVLYNIEDKEIPSKPDLDWGE